MATYNINLNLSTAAAQAQLSALQAAAGKPIRANVNFSQPLGRITGDIGMFDKSMAAAAARVAAFGATSGAIYLVSKALSEAAKSVILIDKELIELNTFLGQSQGALKEFGNSLFAVAKNTATSFSAVAEAAKEFARQGLSMEDTLKRTNDALILSRISGLGAAESVTALTTAINSFNKSGLTSSEVLNKLVQVDSQFSVSSNDLAQALSRVGSSAQDSGVSIDQLIASVTTAQQITGRGGAVIGNALKTIFTRTKRPEVISQLEAIGVTVKDQNGFLLDGVSILKNYTDATKNLSQTEKARTAELLGGIYQINVLNSLINDLSKSNGIYARSLQASSTATDQAFAKNEALNESLSATLERTKANFQQKGAQIAEPLLTPVVRTGAALVNKTLNIFSKGDKEGEDSGKSFGESLLKGLGSAIAGPGLIIVGALAFSIGKKLFSFGVDAAKSLLGMTSASQNVLSLQNLISSTLNNQPHIIQQIVSGQISQTTAAQALLTIMQQQAAQLQANATLSSTLANTLAKGGFTVNPTTGLKRKAMGHIPEADQNAERAGALGGGYSAGAIVGAPSSIGGIMNTSEKVKYVSGFSQPFINPPKNSKAGRMHQENAIKQTGVNPYSSRGFIPNFGEVFNVAQEGYEVLDGDSIKADATIKKISNFRLQQVDAIEKDQDLGNKATAATESVHGNAESFKKVIDANGKAAYDRLSFASVELSKKLTAEGLGVADLRYGQDYKGPTEAAMDKKKGLWSKKNSDGEFTHPKAIQFLSQLKISSDDTIDNKRKNQGLREAAVKGRAAVDGGKNLGFIPNFAYLDNVKNLEKKAGNGTAIFDTEPFPHVRNSSQPTFDSAINDHGGLQNALSDSASMQKGAGLIKSQGFVPNFGIIDNFNKYTAYKDAQERRAQMNAFRKQNKGSTKGFAMQEPKDMMKSMVAQAMLQIIPSVLSGAANPNTVGAISGVQAFAPAAIGVGSMVSAVRSQKTGFGKAKAFGKSGLSALPAMITGFSQAAQTQKDVRNEQFQKAEDSVANKFNKLTSNVSQLSQTIGDLDRAYSDPNVSTATLIKLGKKEQELLRSISKTNPAAATKLATATTASEKELILSDTMESANREKSVKDSSIQFLKLDDNKRNTKSVTNLFDSLSSQADLTKFNVDDLKGGAGGNVSKMLEDTGIGASKELFKNTPKIEGAFIKYLQTNKAIQKNETVAQNQLRDVRRVPAAMQLKNERTQELRTAQRGMLGNNLDQLVQHSSAFGERASISAATDVSIAKQSQDEVGKFEAQLATQAKGNPALEGLIGKGPGKELNTQVSGMISQEKSKSGGGDPKQISVLENILASSKYSGGKLDLIKDIETSRKILDLKLLSMQEKLSTGGGIQASLDPKARFEASRPLLQGAMKHNIGKMFGSESTSTAGQLESAKSLKDKYQNIDFGNAFDETSKKGKEQRAKDIKTGLLDDANMAESAGLGSAASVLRGKANDQSYIDAQADPQVDAYLGVNGTPSDVTSGIKNFESFNKNARQEKRGNESKLAEAENVVKLDAEKIQASLAETTQKLSGTLMESLNAAFAKGFTISGATVIVQNMAPDSKTGKEGQGFVDSAIDYVTDSAKGIGKTITNMFPGTDQPEGQPGYASGYIPNFKDPLKDAIRRESEFVPFNSIRVNQSDKLKQSSNPFGLAVTNTIDEPRGLASIGLANNGYIPNFGLGSLLGKGMKGLSAILAVKTVTDAGLEVQRGPTGTDPQRTSGEIGGDVLKELGINYFANKGIGYVASKFAGNGMLKKTFDTVRAFGRGLTSGGRFISPAMKGQAAGGLQKLAFRAAGSLNPNVVRVAGKFLPQIVPRAGALLGAGAVGAVAAPLMAIATTWQMGYAIGNALENKFHLAEKLINWISPEDPADAPDENGRHAPKMTEGLKAKQALRAVERAKEKAIADEKASQVRLEENTENGKTAVANLEHLNFKNKSQRRYYLEKLQYENPNMSNKAMAVQMMSQRGKSSEYNAEDFPPNSPLLAEYNKTKNSYLNIAIRKQFGTEDYQKLYQSAYAQNIAEGIPNTLESANSRIVKNYKSHLSKQMEQIAAEGAELREKNPKAFEEQSLEMYEKLNKLGEEQKAPFQESMPGQKKAPAPKTAEETTEDIFNKRKTDNLYAGGFMPAFAQEKRAVLSSPSYAGHRDAVPMRSSVYKNAVINSAEIEVPASEVYSRMFGPAGANIKPKDPSQTHAILNPAQQQSLGFNAGFIPNFSTEQFTAAISEAMRNGMASFAEGMIPNVSHSNTVNINDERSYQGNSNSMMDSVLDILQSKFPKEMGKMGPRAAKK